MQIKLPKPFFFEEGKRAVLLLHGFTGNSSDVRQLGRFLKKKGYTSYEIQYEGHAEKIEEIMNRLLSVVRLSELHVVANDYIDV
ncbi:alpha/beta hydrolase, partial [Staphylococcus aureus]|uniref:alpha/beta hydrolase n=1 Tax=Staphylococcus aureus TaxID=1280 RepID=UPI0034D2E263